MVVVVLAALFRAPVAGVGTDRTEAFRKPALSDHRTNALLAQVDALDTALRTVIGAVVPRHLVQAVLTGDDAGLASLDTGRMTKHQLPLLCAQAFDFASNGRNASDG